MEQLKLVYSLLLGLVMLVISSLTFSYIINKNNSVLVLFIGILLTYISCNILSNLNFINENNIFNNSNKIPPILINFDQTKVVGRRFLFPNIFLTIIIFIVCYLKLCLNYNKKLTNNKDIPSIILFFEILLILITIIFIVCFVSFTYTYYVDDNLELELYLDFILKGSIYNTIISLLFGCLIGFLFYNIIHTFYRRWLFFQNKKICKDDGTCYYEPIGSNWFYKKSI